MNVRICLPVCGALRWRRSGGRVKGGCDRLLHLHSFRGLFFSFSGYAGLWMSLDVHVESCSREFQEQHWHWLFARELGHLAFDLFFFCPERCIRRLPIP